MAWAVDPLALSLNESPFPPLPAVRSALARSLDVANRYPEFLPGQLRRMIADRVGVDEEQVVVGTGASGVAMQMLHAVTRPGDRHAQADSRLGPCQEKAPSGRRHSALGAGLNVEQILQIAGGLSAAWERGQNLVRFE